jgi:hypothetical protein
MHLSESARRRILLGGTWILGTIFITAAGLKALDIDLFTQQIARYQLIPSSLQQPLSIALILVEAALGLACLVGFHPAKVLWGMISLLIIFLVATIGRWDLLQGTNCGCFGPIMSGGPGSVVLHTVVLMSLAGVFLALLRKVTVPHSFRWLRVTAGTFAMFFIMFAAQSFSTGSSLSQAAPTGDQVRIFLSATCEKCLKEASKVRDLSDSDEVPPVHLFIGAAYEKQIDEYFKKGNLQVDYTPMTFSQLSRETVRVPKVQVFHAGKIVREWEGDMPSINEVKETLAAASAAEKKQIGMSLNSPGRD